MANIGLKVGSKNLIYNIGNIKCYVNLNKYYKNIILEIPTVSIEYPFSYNMNLYYNNNGHGLNSYFGKYRLGLPYLFTDPLEIENPDMTTDLYIMGQDGYYHTSDNKNYIFYTSGVYKLIDKYDYMYEFNGSGYPTKMMSPNRKYVTLSTTNNSFKYNSNEYGSVGFSNQVSYGYAKFESNMNYIDTRSSVEFTYDNNHKITNIKYKDNGSLTEEYLISYNNNKIEIKAIKLKEAIIIDYNFNDKIEVSKYTLDNTTINYFLCKDTIEYLSNNKTKLTDNYNHSTYYFFDNHYSFLYEVDYLYNSYNLYYDDVLLIHASGKVGNYENELSLLDNRSINSFSNHNLNISEYNETNSFYKTLIKNNNLDNKIYEVSGTGYIYKYITIDGISGNNYLFSIFVKHLANNSNKLKVEISYLNITHEVYSRKSVADSEYELLTIGFHLYKNVKTILIKISQNYGDFLIGGLQLIQKQFGENYKYDSKWNLIEIESSVGKTSKSYDNENLLIEEDIFDGNNKQYAYDINVNNKLAFCSDTITGSEIAITYNQTSYKELSNKITNSNNVFIEKTNTFYSNNFQISKSTDTSGLEIGFDYSFELLRKIKYPDQISDVYYYYLYNPLISSLESNNAESYYSYDGLYKVNVLTSTNSNLVANLGSNNQVSDIKLNNVTINEFEYNVLNQLTKIKYGTSSDSYILDYSNDKLVDIKYRDVNNNESYRFLYSYSSDLLHHVSYYENSTLKTLRLYEYDINDRITKISSEHRAYSYEYQYDNADNVKIVSYETNSIKRIYSIDQTIDSSNISLHFKENNQMYNIFDMIPFNGCLNSIKGIRPVLFDGNELDVELFRYDSELNRSTHHTYNYLAYNLGIAYSASIGIKIKLSDLTTKQYILSSKDNFNNSIELFIEDSYLKIGVNDITYNAISLSNISGWHIFTLSYERTVVGDSTASSNLNISVGLDNQSYINSINVVGPYNNFTTYVGLKYDGSYRLNALIANLIFTDVYYSAQNLYQNYLSNYLNDITFTYKNDDLGLVTNKIINNSNNILSHTYTYKSVSNKKYTLIENENIILPNQSINRAYTYDNMNNVTAITDLTFGNRSYSYGWKSFLETETIGNKHYTYDYDENGNIKKVILTINGTPTITNFVYDSTIKDKLLSVGGNNITYSSTSPLLPTSYKGMSYSYEGKKLIKTEHTAGSVYERSTYEYDDEGLIIRKILYTYDSDDYSEYEDITTYYYDNGNLITEICSNGDRFDYLYDSTSKVCGFIKNNQNIYYYIIDILGNIIGIVDNAGTIVVKYTYDGYGNLINYNGNLLGDSFRYKCYYYDTFILMYYCKSRFYNPEWRRWLTPDSFSYLNTNDVGCINLFVYCNNNPVMYSDGEGNIAISLIVGLAVSFGVGFAASTISQGFQYGWDNINFLQAGLDGLFVLGSTALAYTGIGLIGSMVAGGIMGASQYSLDSGVFHNDFSWSGLVVSTGLGVLCGAISGRGAQNSISIAKNNLNQEAQNGIKALLTSASKYGINSSGYRNTLNLWGKTVSIALNGAISRNFTISTFKIWFSTVGSYIANYYAGKLNKAIDGCF